ncbi:MAG: NAD-dependent epimerase/dehydratase family protein [bacterium]|nr:NAD-dependent epimerase/dehydratase family protein [bacterium]
MERSLDSKLLTYYTGKQILITGGTGYLANSLTALLKNINCTIIRMDLNPAGHLLQEVAARIIDVQGDVGKEGTWVKILDQIDIVFHFAAQTSVYRANGNPVDDFNINVLPMLYCLETCRKKGIKPVILFSGTATEIGMPVHLPVDERHADRPITVYDLHKLMSENYLKYYISQDMVKGTILRLANVYGPGPRSSSADRGVLNAMIRKALKGEEITVYGQGEYIRDYIYVSDVAAAFLLAGSHIHDVNGRHFVIGSGQGHTLSETFHLIADRAALVTGRKVKVVSVEEPATLSPIERRSFIADSGTFTELTGWEAEYSLTEGIDATIKFISNS